MRPVGLEAQAVTAARRDRHEVGVRRGTLHWPKTFHPQATIVPSDLRPRLCTCPPRPPRSRRWARGRRTGRRVSRPQPTIVPSAPDRDPDCRFATWSARRSAPGSSLPASPRTRRLRCSRRRVPAGTGSARRQAGPRARRQVPGRPPATSSHRRRSRYSTRPGARARAGLAEAEGAERGDRIFVRRRGVVDKHRGLESVPLDGKALRIGAGRSAVGIPGEPIHLVQERGLSTADGKALPNAGAVCNGPGAAWTVHRDLEIPGVRKAAGSDADVTPAKRLEADAPGKGLQPRA